MALRSSMRLFKSVGRVRQHAQSRRSVGKPLLAIVVAHAFDDIPRLNEEARHIRGKV
jgi:hypothetical protein